jgi:hypothetical protein
MAACGLVRVDTLRARLAKDRKVEAPVRDLVARRIGT